MAPLHLENFIGGEYVQARTDRRTDWSTRRPALRRAYRRNHPHPESPESRKKSNRKYRISSCGLSQEQFDRLLAAQQHTCGMCHSRLRRGSSSTWTMITRAARGRIDRTESASEDSCHACNIALGYIERRYTMARAYLDSPPVRLLDAA
jgi:hypothetical protein